MKRWFQVSLYSFGALFAIVGLASLLLQQPVEAQSGPTRTIGTITITADSYEPLGNGLTRASGNIRLGDHLRLSGDGAFVEFDGRTLTGNGALMLLGSAQRGAPPIRLLEGAFGADAVGSVAGILTPRANAGLVLDQIAGFAVAEGLQIAAIHVPSGQVAGRARLSLPASARDPQDQTYGPMPQLAYGPALAEATFQLEPGANGPIYSGTVGALNVPHAGIILQAAEGAILSNDGIAVARVDVVSPRLFGAASVPMHEMQIRPQGIRLSNTNETIALPDICFGRPQPCTDAPIRISGIRARWTQRGGNQVLSAEGVLNINLPGNRQDVRISFFTNDADGNGLNGVVEEIRLTLARSTLTLRQIALSSAGLAVDTASIQLPQSLGNLTGSVNTVRITSSGLSIGGGSISLPEIRIGDGSRLRISNPTATLSIGPNNSGYTFGLQGTLLLRIPQNSQDIAIAGSIDTNGQLSVTVNQLQLNIASARLTVQNIALNNNGMTVGSGVLTLPSSLNGVSGQINDIVIDGNGLRIGGGGVTIPFPDFRIGGTNGFAVTGASFSINVAADQNFEMTLRGTVAVTIPGASGSATGSVTINRQGNVTGTLSGFSLGVAGLTLAINGATINGNTFSASEASLRIPNEWGGAAAAVYNIRIAPGSLSIGGGSFTLPTIKAGGFTIQASGALRPINNGYEISAVGGFNIPSLSAGAGCSGIQASLTIFVNTLGATVMEIDPIDQATAVADAGRVIAAAQRFDAELINAELTSLRLRRVGLELNCSIPIPKTGHAVTSLRGSVELNSGSVRVNVGITIATQFELPVLGPPIRGTADAYIQSSPFEIGLSGSLHVFIFQVGGANIRVSESRGFEATVWIQMWWGRGDLTLRAWSSTGGFFLTGRATITVGFGKGAIWRGCLKHPCCTVRWPPWKSSCRLCDGPCIEVPPVNLTLGQVGTEFGRFTGDRWGFKGFVTVLGYGAGFFIDHRGNLTVGNVDNIRLVTMAQIRQAHDAWLQAQADGADLSNWSSDGISFQSNGDTTVSVSVPETTDVIFSLSRNRDTPTLSLQMPDGRVVRPDSLPTEIQYQEVTTYTLAPATQQVAQLTSGVAPEVLAQIAVDDSLPENYDATLAQVCMDQYGPDLAASLATALNTPVLTNPGRFRLVNATPEQVSVDLLIGGQLSQGGRAVAFGRASSYETRTAGMLAISVVPTGRTGPVLAATNLVLGAGATHSLVLVSRQGVYELLPLNDALNEPPEGQTSLRLAHVTPGFGPVDIASDSGQLLFTGVGYGESSAYVTLNPGVYTLEVRAAGTEQVLLRLPNVSLEAGDVSTVFAMTPAQPATVIYLPVALASFQSRATNTPLIGSRVTPSNVTAPTRLIVMPDLIPASQVRFVHAARGRAAVDVTFESNRSFANVVYRQVTAYLSRDPGMLRAQVVAAGATGPALLDTLTNLARLTDYTIVALPTASGLETLILTDDNRFPAIGQTKIRFVHLDPDAGAVTVAAVAGSGSTTLAQNVGFRATGGYRQLPGGVYTLELRAANGTVLHRISNATLQEGNVYTLFAFDTGSGSELALNVDVASQKFTQQLYSVDQAQAGVWQMIVSGDPGVRGDPDAANANYLLQVLGSNPAPAISLPRLAPIPATTRANVSWRLTSDDAATVNIYATTGPITATQTITDAAGTVRTIVVPVYTGEIVAANVPSAIDGTPQSVEIDLRNSATGRYFVWIEADDGRNAPTRTYARRATASASLAAGDVGPDGEFLLQVDDLEPFDIDQTLAWPATWTAGIQTTPGYRTLDLTWARHPHPDADSYQLRISSAALQETQVITVGEALNTSLTNLAAGGQYTLQLEAIDRETGRISLSEAVNGTPQDAPFTLTGPASLGTTSGQPLNAQVTLSTALAPYPDLVSMTVITAPDGLSVAFSKLANPPCGILGIVDPQLYCPTVGGTPVNVEVTTTGTMTSGDYAITIRAEGGGMTRDLTLPLRVQGANFNLSVAPSGATLRLEANASLDITLSVDGAANPNDPIFPVIWGLPTGVQETFLRNGVVVNNPTLAPGQPLTLRLTLTETDPRILAPGGYAPSIFAYNNAYWDAAIFELSIVNPNPSVNVFGLFRDEVTIDPGETALITATIAIPADWTGGPLTLRTLPQFLPEGSTATFRRLPDGQPAPNEVTLPGPGEWQVEIAVTTSANTEIGWYLIALDLYVGADRTNPIDLFDVFLGVGIPSVDFDLDDDDYQFVDVFPGTPAEFAIEILVPDTWLQPVEIQVFPDTLDPAITGVTLQLDDTTPVAAGTPITLDEPGFYTLRVNVETSINTPPGYYLVMVDFISGLVWNTTYLYVGAFPDFDLDANNYQFRSVPLGTSEVIFTVELSIPPAWPRPVLMALNEVLRDRKLTTGFRIIDGNPAFAPNLTLPAGAGDLGVEVRVTIPPSAEAGYYLIPIDYIDTNGEILSYTDIVLELTAP